MNMFTVVCEGFVSVLICFVSSFFFVPERQHFKHVPFRAHVNCATVSADYTPPAIIKLKTKSFTAMATYEKLNAVMPPCAPKTRSVWMKVCTTA